MSTSSSSPAEYVRRGLLKVDEATTLRAVDALNLRGAKLSPVIAIPLRNLQLRRDVATFCASAPVAAVRALLELLADAALARVIEVLDENAESPTYEQLRDAVGTLREEGAGDDEIVAMLTFAIGEQFPAAPHCEQLIIENEQWTLPPLPDVAAPTSLLTPKEPDEQVREQRRRRREEEKKKKQRALTRPTKPGKGPRNAPPSPVRESPAPVSSAPLETPRRRIILTPAEAAEFDTDHALAGAIVLVDVPFDAVDPAAPDVKEKQRPALVVGVGENAVLVRGIFSKPFATRSLFQPWRRVGIEHVSYLDDKRTKIIVAPSALRRLGQLSDEEWNATF